jgi:hypothetical protein
MKTKRVTAIGGALLLCLSLNACAPLMVAGFAGSALSPATDALLAHSLKMKP